MPQVPESSVVSRIAIDASTAPDDAVAAVRQWVAEHVPAAWREAGERGGAAAIREVRSRADYEAWYPTFGASGLVAPTWPVAYGGLDLPVALARRIDAELRPYNLGRLNPLGLNLAAPALFAHGTEEQRLRYLPRIVDNSERWCQLFSEPGAGSDLASLATRAERDGDEWRLSGQKVWTTWAHVSDWGVVLARTDGGRAEAQGHHLLPARPPPARRRGAAAAPHRRRGRLQRGVPRRRPGARRPAGGRGGRRVEGRQRHAVGRAPDGVGERLGRRRPHRRLRHRTGSSGRPPTTGIDPIAAPGAHAGAQRGADPRLDEPAGAGRPPGRSIAGARELDRQGAPGRAQPAHPAAGHRPARTARDRRGTARAGRTRTTSPTRCGACCAAGPTRSRAAPPR